MIEKEKILESWIMVEHLSEGDISLRDKSIHTLSDLQENDFYSLFQSEVAKENFRPRQKGGIVVYFDIFKFSEVISLLRKKYHLKPTNEEIRMGDKFGFALYFDKELTYQNEMFFFTASAYIRYKRETPSEKEFREFEEELKEQFDQDFDGAETNPMRFNEAIQKILQRFDISVKNCRMQVVKNIETDATNLHSFFIDDLEKAKKIKTTNLDAYLFGNTKGRINLDSKNDSPNFQPNVFEKILQPKNYPLGRFPSNTKYALSFMQQVAVNLSIGYDNSQMRSVNGPPGTGKTTLLKDIFAELIVQQAHQIARLSKHRIEGTDETKYYNNASIGEIPEAITENNIVVASSNNGAVQNIVNELPLIKEIDETLIEDLKETDYFWELANAKVSAEWKADEDGKRTEQLCMEPNQGEDTFWGLFSMEGGKSDNMNQILTTIKHMIRYLNEEYDPDEDIYKKFEKQYREMEAIRQKAQMRAVFHQTNSREAKPLDMNQEYEQLQLSNPWFDETYRIAQSKLFLTALRVRKQFLDDNRKNLKAATIIWSMQEKYLDNKRVIVAAWNWINMAIPVISSTFASFSRMCKYLGKETLGHLFVDEAGQALPQAAVGAIYRSRHVMVVGDPSQIKPVLTLDASVLSMLSKHFGVTEKYLSDSASAQTLVDAASSYGFYREPDKEEESWIGIPLWVHRRCQDPMFTISNHISYNGLMVQGMPGLGKTGWYDVGGKANNKYVEAQGEFLLQKIKEMMKENPKIADKTEKDQIYVITPFANVAYQLAQKLKSIGFTRFEHGKPTNVGTIHTFQGKEAPIVFLVLGADSQSSGAANWAVSEPNMMNVAATRAKKEFYIIGDRTLYLDLNSDVATDTYRIIRRYKKEHPELVNDEVPTAAPISKQVEQPNQSTEQKRRQQIGQTKTEWKQNRIKTNQKPDQKPVAMKTEQTQTQQARIKGKITYVGTNKRTGNGYAYVQGENGVKYTINETIYAQTAHAAEVLQKGNHISFVAEEKNDRTYATDIKRG
ncbi:MAG: DEAD/DEAH box helicase [Lachnospiraceae bacterium]